MANGKILLLVIVGAAIVLTVAGLHVVSTDGSGDYRPLPETYVNNNSVYLAGCKTYQRSEPPAIVYKTVRRNFVTWPCALEVPPPDGAIEWERNFAVNHEVD